MRSNGSLLRLQQGKGGNFLDWLEKLGLKELLRQYPISYFVKWGWLIPQSRVIFPERFFLEWEDFPSYGIGLHSGLESEQLLWDSHWFIDENEPLWFLDPFFRPDDREGRVLLGKGSSSSLPELPKPFLHPRGSEVIPYVDYFFHWQGYALIDIICYTDCFGPVLAAPNLHERLSFIESCRISSEAYWKPEEILTLPNRWGGLSEPMTWLSHYRSFRDAISSHNSDNGLLRKGALELAAHLGVSEVNLAAAIKEKMLVLAQNWRRDNNQHSSWTREAYPLLQADIYMAVEWLCLLSGKTLDYFLDQWSHDTIIHPRWPELHAVLEYDFFTDRKEFLKVTPRYFYSYCKQFVDETGLHGEQLERLVDAIRQANYPFDSFLGAFRKMNEEMTYRFEHKGGLDFRERRPLDYYLILAIRAEACLRFALDKAGMLNTIKPKQQKLSKYIEYLARQKDLSNKAIGLFKENLPKTRMHEAKEYPVEAIMALNTTLSGKEDFLVKAFLCCELARNYFAHHYSFDKEMRSSKESGFMLTGILATVVYLLANPEVNIATHLSHPKIK